VTLFSDFICSLLCQQAMTPRMQLGGMHTANAKGSSADLNGDLSKFAGDSRDFAKDKMNYNSRKLGDTRQGNLSVEIWKRAFTDALKRLCPLQGEGLECGCLPALNRMVSLRTSIVSFLEFWVFEYLQCMLSVVSVGYSTWDS
jgi:hypothetical protein